MLPQRQGNTNIILYSRMQRPSIVKHPIISRFGPTYYVWCKKSSLRVPPVSPFDKQLIEHEYGDLSKGNSVIPWEVKLRLKDNAVRVVNPPRRIPKALKSRLKCELDNIENDQIIVKVDEPTDWVNSLVVVEKPQTGKLRICLYPKGLNEAIRRPHYPMYTLEDVTSKLTNATCFSLLDIMHAYWSVKLNESSS